MIKILYSILVYPLQIYNYIFNFMYLKLTNSSYKTFPKINGRIIRRGRGKLNIGESVRINSDEQTNPVGLCNRCLIYIAPNAHVIIGNNVGISTSLIYSKVEIILEDNVLIGGGCQILDNDFHSLDYNERIFNGDNNILSSPILIKEGAFVGTSTIILKGVTIGSRSIIGAGSVVSKNIPDNEIWAGNPAKFIKFITDF